MRFLLDLLSDLRYAFRAFRRNPAFAVTGIFCLALGIGANVTIFSITTSFLFSLPSCRDSASLIAIRVGGNSGDSIADYKFIRNSHVFAGMAGINPEREVNWRDGEKTSRLYAGRVTDDYFSTLDVPFALGRGIAPGEGATVVISDRLWRSRFAADSGVLGRKMVLDGAVFAIAGVLPADHRTVVGFGFSPDIYVPVTREDDYVQLYARLPKGMSRLVARERLLAVLRELDRIHPKEGWKRTLETQVTGVTGLDTLGDQMMGPILAFFAMLMIVVGLVLLIACTNVASLLLARASSRSRELAIRQSLGASRSRIMRHLLAESLLLAVLGCACGLALDLACARALSNLSLPLPVPIRFVITPEWRLLWYSVAIAFLSAVAAGLAPALKAVRKDINPGRVWGLRSFLVVGQLAVSIVLLSTGFLFIHNLLRATSMNPGFDVQHTVWGSMRLVPENYADQSRQTALVNEALGRLRALPGVQSAAIARRVPLNDNCVIGGEMRTDLSASPVRATYTCNDVGPDYFHTIGIPILRGREFNTGDRKGSQPVAIVNETFARTIFGNRDPVGHTITGLKTMRIVGVAKDSKYFTLGENQRLAVYEPYFASDQPVNLQFLLRTAGTPSAYVKPVTDLLVRLDASAAIETKPLSQALGLALLPSRAGAALLGAMGILSLALAAIGLYGMLLYAVSQRTREIGLRMALGATPSQVLRIVCRDSLLLVGLGAAFGLGLAFLATKPLELFLVPGMNASDPQAFAAVLAVLGIVAFTAMLAPAVRALRVDPMTALRYE
jgi:predicted permease